MEGSIIQGLIEKINSIENEIQGLKARRISQEMYLPSSIKTRHMGEGNRFIRGGKAADLPASGEPSQGGFAQYFDSDNNKIYVFNTTTDAWKSVTLS